MTRIRFLLGAVLCDARFVGLLALAIVAAAPHLSEATRQLISFAVINILIACSINLLTGMAGQISLGQAAFMGIAAYASVLLVKVAGWPFALSVPAGALMAAAAGWILSWPAGRVREFYLAMMTLGFGMIFVEVVREWDSVTGGVMGITGIPSPQLRSLVVFGRTLDTADYLRLLAVIAAAVLFWLSGLNRSRVGRAFFAVHESETAADSIGIDSAMVKRQAYTLSAGLAGLAGALYGHLVSYVGPESFELHRSIEILVMSVIGGLGSLPGQVVGAVALTWLPLQLEVFEDFKFILYGAVLVAIFVVMPRGLAGLLFPPPRMIRPAWRQATATPAATTEGSARRVVGRTVLTWTGLRRSFGGLTAVADFSCELAAGEVLGLIGPNGSGKSTTINVLSGLYPPSSGRIELAGADVSGLPPHVVARRGMVRTFQDPRLVGRFTVLENVLLGAHVHARYGALEAGFGIGRIRRDEPAAIARAAGVLTAMGLDDVADRVLETLPYGYRRLVEVARALMVEPDVLLLDEPAAGLSEGEIGRLERAVLDLRAAGVAVLIVDHHMDFLARVVDRVVVLDGGREIFRGAIGAMRDDPKVAECYLGRMETTDARG